MGQSIFQQFGGFREKDLSCQAALMLTGSGAKIGHWFSTDSFDILSTHAYAVSGVFASGTATPGTFNGIIQIQQSHDKSSYVQPAVAIEHSGSTVTIQQVGIRAPWARAVCTEWNSSDLYYVSLRAYKQYNEVK